MLLLHNYLDLLQTSKCTLYFKYRVLISLNLLDTAKTVVLWHPFKVANALQFFWQFLSMVITNGSKHSFLSCHTCCLILVWRVLSAWHNFSHFLLTMAADSKDLESNILQTKFWTPINCGRKLAKEAYGITL